MEIVAYDFEELVNPSKLTPKVAAESLLKAFNNDIQAALNCVNYKSACIAASATNIEEEQEGEEKQRSLMNYFADIKFQDFVATYLKRLRDN
jgi:hypothetical protein